MEPEMPPLAPLQPHAARCRVTYRMTDQMGVVYYGNYLELFEMGRSELLRASGQTYRQMELDGYRLPVIHAAADYLAPARYDDLLLIRTRIGRLTRIRVDFQYEVVRESDQALLCRGVTHHAIIGREGKPRRLDAAWMELLQPLLGQPQAWATRP